MPEKVVRSRGKKRPRPGRRLSGLRSLAGDIAEEDEAIRFPHWQLLQHNGVVQTEDRRVCANPECEGQSRCSGEPRALAQESCAEADVTPEVGEPSDSIHVARPLTNQGQ